VPQPNTPPAFVRPLLAEADASKAKDALERQHPAYTEHATAWQVQLDAFEGNGGFLTGDYLWPYAAESATDYQRRTKMARYHNYVETLVDLYVRFMFSQGVKRTAKNDEYLAWTDDVDGAGTSLTDFLKKLAAVSLVTGHAGTLVDKTPEEPDGPSRADENAQVFLTVFPSTAIVDWRFDRATLAAVKLREAAPATALIATEEPEDEHQWLLWDREGWARFNAKGDFLSGDIPNLGLVPLVLLRPKPSVLNLMLGRALISNVNVVRALYNRASEEDEVLRRQAFSLLTVSVPSDGNVAAAREQIGTTLGSATALVVQGEIDYKTPDQSVPGSIRENISYLVQEIYRAAHVRFRTDSLAAETAESIRLQHQELNEMLQGFAKALGQVEMEIARAYFAWTSPTPDAAQTAFEAAEVEATYPDEFFLADLLSELEAWAEAIRMDLGDEMNRRIKKQAARRVDPEMPPDVLAKVDAEIDAMDSDQLKNALPMETGTPEEDEDEEDEPSGVAA
jgi:hypothetical protein